MENKRGSNSIPREKSQELCYKSPTIDAFEKNCLNSCTEQYVVQVMCLLVIQGIRRGLHYDPSCWKGVQRSVTLLGNCLSSKDFCYKSKIWFPGRELHDRYQRSSISGTGRRLYLKTKYKIRCCRYLLFFSF